jgi:phage repressor protein C with HTH and peptisase S24 domain
MEFYVGPRRATEAQPLSSNGEDIAFIGLHDVQASAGTGRFAYDAEIVSSLGFPLPWLSRHGVNPERASLIFVDGDSMAPTIASGSIALVNHNRHEVISRRVYAFREGDELFVKRLELIDDSGLFVTCDNPEYASRVIRNHDLEAVSVIGEVIWTGRSR